MNFAILKSALLVLLLVQSAIALGQSVTTQDLLASKEQWPTYAADGRTFQFEGRVEGRSAITI